MKNLVTFIFTTALLAIIAACNRNPEKYTCRWQNIDPTIDSLTSLLDDKYLTATPRNLKHL